MKNQLILSILAAVLLTSCQKKSDVIIYGGTSAGIAAAIQASRMGKSVVIIEPSNRLGGLTTGGLGATDIGNKQAIGGISREFYKGIKEYYDDPSNWKWQKPEEYRQDINVSNSDAMWTFEPSAALEVYRRMIEKEDIAIKYDERLDRLKGVKKDGTQILEIKMENGSVYKGRMFIDATYEGDLMAAAGVSYTVGRESNTQYGETLNGVQANITSLTLKGRVSRNQFNHNFIEGVDPFVIKGDPSSGLLPFVEKDTLPPDGTGDNKIQAYCYRMTLTDNPDNRIPFEKPAAYNELDYELLFRNYEAAKGPVEEMYNYGDKLVPWINTRMPGRKTDTNNQKGFSTDFIGQNYNYPEASYEERDKIAEHHLNFQKGLMWTLAYHPRIPEKVRAVVSQYGMCKDEFTENGGWTDQLYIRESRRLLSDYMMSQKNCEGLVVAEDAIGLGAYGMDSHNVQRYVGADGFVRNEGNVEAPVPGPYPISFRSIVPKKNECTNLLIPVCLGATHIAYGSIRMEPVFMILGQSAATAACMAIDEKTCIQSVDYVKLKKQLLNDGQILSAGK
jgi:hypothetical protein